MNQFEFRKSEREKDDRYDKLLSAVRNNDVRALRESFPDAESLIMFNQNRRSRHEHVLEAMVKYASPEFVNRVFEVYFNDDDEKTLELKDKFLQARSDTGKKINYEYFAPYLPKELTDNVADCFGVERVVRRNDEYNEPKTIKPLNDDVRTDEPKSVAEKITLFLKRIDEKINKKAKKTVGEIKAVDTRPRLEQIYDIIKKENRSLNEFRNKNITRRHLALREVDEKPVEQLYTAHDKSKALKVEMEAVPSVFIRRLNVDENGNCVVDVNDDVSYKKDELVRIDWADNFDGTKRDLVKSLYVNADFPEDYMWAVSSLRNFGKEYAEIIGTDAVNLAQVKEFAKDGGRFFIESGVSTRKGNSSSGNYDACAGKRDGFSYIAFNAMRYNEENKSSDNMLLHELIHRADLNSKEAFSNTEIFKQASVLMVAESDDGRVAKKARHVANTYQDGEIYNELLAYMNEGGSEGVKYSKLATTVRDICGIYVDAKVHNDVETMEKIISYKPDWVDGLVQKSFELSNGGVVLDKEKLSQNVSVVAEELNKFKESLGYKYEMEFSPLLKEKQRSTPISVIYMDFIEEQKGIESKEQGFKNLVKWGDNISNADNEKEFFRAVTMAYCYVKSFDKSGGDVFDRNNIERFGLGFKNDYAKMFRDEAIHLKALDVIQCSKEEALLANDINMPIKDLIACKRLGKTMVDVVKDENVIKENLSKMIEQAVCDKDYLKLMGAVECFADRKGIKKPLEYNIETKSMLEAVTTLSANFLNKIEDKKDVSKGIEKGQQMPHFVSYSSDIDRR